MELPRATVKHLVLARLEEAGSPVSFSGEGISALCAAGEVFVHYLTVAARAACKDTKRHTISADDVMAAVAVLNLEDYRQILADALCGERCAGLPSSIFSGSQAFRTLQDLKLLTNIGQATSDRSEWCATSRCSCVAGTRHPPAHSQCGLAHAAWE